MRLLILLLPLFLAGCIGADMKEAVIEMSKSDRSWCASVTTIYGTVKMGGSGLGQGRMICNGEGWQLDSQAAGGGGGSGLIVIPAAPRVFMQEAPGVQEIDPSSLKRAAPKK